MRKRSLYAAVRWTGVGLVWMVLLSFGCRGEAHDPAMVCHRTISEVDDAALSLEEQAVADALRGFRILRDCFVDPIDEREVLAAGWDGALGLANARGLADGEIASALEKLTEAGFEGQLRQLFTRLPAEAGDLSRAAIAAMARILGDSKTYYQEPATFQEQIAYENGRGLSSGISTLRLPEGLLVWNVQQGGPGARAGLRPGDIIKEIDGVSVTTPPAPREGVPQILSVDRPGTGSISLEITFDRNQSPFVRTEMLPSGVAYIRVTSFLMTPIEFTMSFDAALEALAAASPRGWILDLRSNNGGNVYTAAYLAGRLGYEGVVLTAQNRFFMEGQLESDGQSLTQGSPVVILVNARSASASEVIAGAFQDAGKATIVGSKTAGSVSGAGIVPLAGGALWFTAQRLWVGPSSLQLDKVGVQPDVVVALTSEALAAGIDAQIEAAIRIIDGQP